MRKKEMTYSIIDCDGCLMGSRIESYEEALNYIAEWEKDDMISGDYEKDFYQIIEKAKSGITKGEWVVSHGAQFIPSIGSRELHKPIAHLCEMNDSQWFCEEAEANARLIAEAGNVANETGKSPREILNERNELLEALKEIMDSQFSMQLLNGQRIKALEAIKKATE